MATRRPIVLVSGISSELPVGDDIDGALYQGQQIVAGSGLVGGGLFQTNPRVDVALAANPSGLYFTGDNKLGFDGHGDNIQVIASGSNAVYRTVENKFRETVSVLDFGADATGVTTSDAAFSAAAKASPAAVNIVGAEGTLPRAPMCRVVVPAGNYAISSELDTDNREVLWVVDPGANISGYSFLNGELYRPGQRQNDYHHGTTDYACTYSIRANVDLEDGAEVNGITTASGLASYTDRDSVAVYVDNAAPAALVDVASASYTATTVTIVAPSASVLRQYRRGMIIDTKHTPKWSGIVDSWNSDGSVITVTGWYQVGGGGATGTPSGSTGCVLNGFTKVWAHNANVYLTSDSYASKGTGFELGVLNNKGSLDFANGVNQIWGYDAVSLGTYEGAVAFIARSGASKFYRGFQCNDATQAGFLVGGTPAWGFYSEQTSGDPFRYVKSGTTLFKVDTNGILTCTDVIANSASLGSASVVGTPFIDFNSSGNAVDYDVRLVASGGTGTSGNGVLSVIAGASTKFHGVISSNQDNVHSCGVAALRWSEIFAGTGTINTSDEREKQDIEQLDEAEKKVAIRLKSLIKKFRFKDAVAAKGDKARIHVGIIAQEVIAAFAAEGLDATRYGVLCHDEWEAAPEVVHSWPAEYDDEGLLVRAAGSEVIEPQRLAGDRYGVRYDELLAFIISAL